MLAISLISDSHYAAQDTTTLRKAIEICNTENLMYLPIISPKGIFLGMLHKDDMESQENHNLKLRTIQQSFLDYKVFDYQHIIDVFTSINSHNIPCIAVVDSNNTFKGIITYTAVSKSIAQLMGSQIPGAIIVIEIEYRDYSLAHIARIIEENNYKLTCSFSRFIDNSSTIELLIRVNSHDIGLLASELNRHGYAIKTYHEGRNSLDELYDSRVHNLLHYLQI